MIAESLYYSAFLAGLLGGVHCAGMCGGIVGALSLSLDKSEQSRSRWFHLAYSSGRIVSYTLAGMLLGGISMLATHLSDLHALQSILQILSLLLMLGLGLYIGGWWQGLSQVELIGSRLWNKIEPFSRQFIPVKNIRQAFLLGILWGWLPCGLVYTVLIWSISSASAWKGALMMLSFGLGTLPVLLSMGLFASNLASFMHNKWVRYTAGFTIIVFAGVQFFYWL